MTLIDLTTLADDIGGTKNRSATITARATRPRSAGKNLTVPDTVTLKVRNGEPVEPFVLEAPDGTWAWEISVLPLGWNKRDAIIGIYRFSGEEVDWADMTPVDPKTLAPLVPFPPTVQQVLDLATAKAEAAETAAENAAAAQASSAGFAGAAAQSAGAATSAAATAAQAATTAVAPVAAMIDTGRLSTTSLKRDFLPSGGWAQNVLASLRALAAPINTPTIAYSAVSYLLPSALPSPVEYRPSIAGTGSAVNNWDGRNNAAFKIHSGRFRTANGGSNDMCLEGEMKPGGSASAARWPMIVEFNTTSPQIEIAAYGGLNYLDMRIEVNGSPAIGDYVLTSPNLGQGKTALLTFPDSRARRICLYLDGGLGLYSIRVPSGRTITKPTDTLRTGVIVGDSYPNGSGSPTEFPAGASIFDTYAREVLRALGCNDLALGAIGGSGFTQSVASSSQYINRVSAILAMSPSVMVVNGSINDVVSTPAAIQAAAEAFLDATASIPERYVLGVMKSGNDANYNAVKAAAASKNVPFIEMRNFVYGTGNVLAPGATGNAGVFLLPDNSHPTFAAHRAIASAVFQQIAALKS